MALDNPRWSELSHAYGSARDIPELLQQIAEAPGRVESHESEPWFSLWSSLCHQGDVYSASYAAVPHIVEIARTTSEPVDFGFYQLPAAIEVGRKNGKGPEIPIDLEEAYERALSQLTECAALHRHEVWDRATLRSVMAALAVSKSDHRIAEAVLNLDDFLIDKLIELDFD